MSHRFSGHGHLVAEPTVWNQLLKRLRELRLGQVASNRDHNGLETS
jgi:hypothetical protein